MTEEIKTAGIVINARPYAESDLVVTLLTGSHGVLTAMAKGARKSRKRFSGGIEPFTAAEFGLKLRSSGMAVLLSMDGADYHLGIRDDFDRISAGAVLLELAAVFAAPGEASDSYSLFLTTLKLLEASEDPFALCAACTVKFLEQAGFRVPCDTCARCGIPLAGRESLFVGDSGIYCGRCGSGMAGLTLDPGAAGFMRMASGMDTGQLGRLRLSEAAGRAIFRFLGGYAASVSGKRIKSLANLARFSEKP